MLCLCVCVCAVYMDQSSALERYEWNFPFVRARVAAGNGFRRSNENDQLQIMNLIVHKTCKKITCLI